MLNKEGVFVTSRNISSFPSVYLLDDEIFDLSCIFLSPFVCLYVCMFVCLDVCLYVLTLQATVFTQLSSYHTYKVPRYIAKNGQEGLAKGQRSRSQLVPGDKLHKPV